MHTFLHAGPDKNLFVSNKDLFSIVKLLLRRLYIMKKHRQTFPVTVCIFLYFKNNYVSLLFSTLQITKAKRLLFSMI